MNALLSLFLSFAMIFSGGTLPAAADTATTLTIQDFVLDYDGESYPLGYDFALTAAAGQDELILHFEAIDSEGEVLLPISGKANADGVSFAISEKGSAYTMSAETLNQMLGMEESDAAAFETITKYMEEYAGLLSTIKENSAKPVSAEQQAALMDALYANMSDLLTEETTWDFGTGEIPAVHTNGFLSLMDIYAAMDSWMAMGDETVAPMLSTMLDMYNMILPLAMSGEAAAIASADTDAASIGVIGGSDGPTAVYVAGAEFEPVESFTQLIETMAAGNEELLALFENESIELDIISAVEDDTNYELANLYMVLDEEAELAMNVNGESAISPEAALSYFDMYIESPETSIGVEAQIGVEGDMADPDAVDVVMMISSSNAVDLTDYENEDAVEDILYTDSSMLITSSSIYEDGLEHTEVIIESANGSERYVDGELTNEEDAEVLTVELSMDESASDEGETMTDYGIHIDINGEENIVLSFSTVLSREPVEDYFAGKTAVELTADTESEAYNTLSIDAMALMSDAMAIAANEEFAAFADLLTGTVEMDDYVIDEDGEEIVLEEENGILIFESLEDAAEVFQGSVVDYLEPEDYVLDSVMVSEDGSYLMADYSSEDGGYISLSQEYSETGLSDNELFIFEDGELNPMDQTTATLYKDEDGVYYSAQFELADGSLHVYFDGCETVEDVQAILEGLML